MKKRRKKERKSFTSAPPKKGLKDQIKKYVNYAKDIIKTNVHTMEKKLKKLQHSKDKITLDSKKEINSQERKDSKISEEIKFIENNSKENRKNEKQNTENESLEIKDSTEISEINDDDDTYGVQKESPEKLNKRHKHKKKKKRRRHFRNMNKKHKTSHKHRRVHKKHRHNKRKKHHKRKHKKHHKYRYLVLDDLRRDNFRGRSDLYSAERRNQGNTSHSAENSQSNSKINSDKDGYSEENNDYQSFRKNSMVGAMLGRNTRFYIVKNVRSTVSTLDPTEDNNWSFHKRFNIIGNNLNPNMTIISANVDTDKNTPSVFNLTNSATLKNNDYTAASSSSDSSSSAESSDGLPIDKWVQVSIPTNESVTLATTPVKPETTEIQKDQGKRKYFYEQQNLTNEDVLNDTDYLSRNDELIFNDWLRTVDRLKFTQVDYRKSNNIFKTTLKTKYSTNNVKSILFFKASDEFDRSAWRPETQKETTSSEEEISQHLNKHATRRNNDMKPIKFSRKPFKTIDTKSSLEISLEKKGSHVNVPKRHRRPKLVQNKKIRKATKTVQSHEEGLVKNLAKQLKILEKINKDFDNEKATNIHSNNKRNSTEVTQEFDVDKQTDLDVWIPSNRKDDTDSSEAGHIFEESGRRKYYLKNKQNTINTTILATKSTRETTKGVKRTTKKKQTDYSIEVTTLLHRIKDTEKIGTEDKGYEPFSYYSEIFTTTDQTLLTIRNEDLSIELHQEPVTLKQHSKEPSFGRDDKVELMSGEKLNVPEETQFATKMFRRNKRIENWQRTLSNKSTLLPKNIRVKILKKLSEITNYNNTLLRQNKRLRKLDVSEISDEERILKSNIYKYFGHSDKIKEEHNKLNRNITYLTNGDKIRRLLGIELNNDSSRSDTTAELV